MAVTSNLTAYEVANSVNISANTSKLYVKLTATTSGASYNDGSITSTVKINGTTYRPVHRLPLNTTTTILEKTLTIVHNSNGKKTVPITYSIPTQISAGTMTGSKDVVLSDIPRYGTSKQSLVSKTETSITMSWSSDSTVDYMWYSKNNGSTWTGVNVTDGKSGSYTIDGLTPNTTYNIKTRIRRKDSQLTTDSSKLAVATYSYPYCSDSPDFVLGEPLKLTMYNPLNREITVDVIGADDSVLATDIMTGTTIEGYVTEKFISNCYASIPNSQSGAYKVRVIYGDNVNVRDTGNTYTLNLSDCKPTFNDFVYKDVNTTVTDITGNDQVLIKGLSNLEVTIPVANKMVAQKNATPNKYTAEIEGKNASAIYSDNDVNINLGGVNDTGIKRLSVTAYDSRLNGTSVYKDITVYEYTKPVVNVEVARFNNFDSQTMLKITGTYDVMKIDEVNKNSITNVSYRYQEIGGEWSNWFTAKTTVSGDKYTCNDIIVTLDNTKAFNIEVKVADKLDESIGTGNVDIGVPVFFIATNTKQAYVQYKQLMQGKAEDINNADLDEYKNEFVAGYGYDLQNTPNDVGVGHMMSIPRHDLEGYTTQLFSPYGTDNLYLRKCDGGTWSKWSNLSLSDKMTAYLTANQKFPNNGEEYAFINLDGVKESGSKFTLASGTTTAGNTVHGIKIPSGVKKIEISSTATFQNNNSTSTMYFVLYIYRLRNGASSIVSRYTSSDILAGRNSTVSITPFQWDDVQEGDIFFLRVYKSLTNGSVDFVGAEKEMRTFLNIGYVE